MMNPTHNRPAIRYGLGILSVAILLAVSQAVWAQAGLVTDENVVERITTMKTPADHHAIAAYYQAKATAATAEVARHQAMVKGYKNAGNPGKQMARHCEALLETAKKQKAEYESMAKEHADMAGAAAK